MKFTIVFFLLLLAIMLTIITMQNIRNSDKKMKASLVWKTKGFDWLLFIQARQLNTIADDTSK